MQTYTMTVVGLRNQAVEFTAELPHDDAARTWADEMIAEFAEDDVEILSAKLEARGLILHRI